MVGNFYAGARAEWPLLVHNGNDTPTTFSIYYREPDHTGEGYVEAPPEAKGWVIIADCTPVIAPKTTQEIMVAIEIPRDYGGQLPPKWEFWIGVKDTTQTGMIQTEICSRWLISMRS